MSEVRDLILKIMQPEATDFDKYWERIPNRANYSKQELAELMYKEISNSNNLAAELAKALRVLIKDYQPYGIGSKLLVVNAKQVLANYEESLE